MAPVYLQKQFNFSAIQSLQSNTLAIIGLIISCTIYGILADKFSIGKVLIVGCIIAVVTITCFYLSLESYPYLLFITYSLAGLGVGVVGSFAYFMVKVFPTDIRYSGVSFSFNMAYAIAGGVTPLLLSIFTDFFNKLAPAFYVVSLFSIGAIIGILLLSHAKNYFAKEME